MRTKTITLTVEAPRGTFPLRHLEAYVQECLRQYPLTGNMSQAEISQREQDLKTLTTTIRGDTLVTTIEKTLSYAEELADDLEQATAGLLSLRSAYDEDGQLKVGPDGKVPGEVQKLLRDVIWANYVRPASGSGVEGTQAPAAPPASPNTSAPPPAPPTDTERRDMWRSYAAMGGWQLREGDGQPSLDNIRTAIRYVRQVGMSDLTAEEVARWEGVPDAGSLL